MLFFKSTNEKIRQALLHVCLPGSDQDIVTSGVLSSITHDKGEVTLVLECLPSSQKETQQNLSAAIHKALDSISRVKDIRVIYTAPRAEDATIHEQKPAPHAKGHQAIHLGDKDVPLKRDLAPGVKAIIAVASGKGGVGKSSVAANLAVALAEKGQKVGLMDADIYGPSQARMMHLDGRPETIDTPQGKMLRPLENFGVKVMSMAFMVEENRALIWRGLMVQSAVQQFLRDIDWGDLDVLVVDMPPGTGDAALTLAQKVPLAGAVIVSTPQDIALLDASRAAAMFEKVGTPVLGIIENMSLYCCPNCGHTEEIFGHGGAQKRAQELGVPFLGALPLDKTIRQACDAGEPLVTYYPDSTHARTFVDIASAILQQLDDHKKKTKTA